MNDLALDPVLVRWPGLVRRVPTTQELLERDAQTATAIRAYLDATAPVREKGLAL